ncbi:MAG: ABC transporter permease [Chloroflexota bacterium]|jgi:putative ABC transport system permease protein
MLRKKLLRDLWRQRWQVSAVIFIIFLGTALFISSYLAYQNLRDSYRDVQVRTKLADVTVEVTKVSDNQARQVRRLPGVEAAEVQLIVDLPGIVPKGRDREGNACEVKPVIRLISIPLREQPPINQIIMVDGRYPRRQGEVIVEHHFADYHHIRSGDEVQVETPAGKETLKIVGVGVNAEYLWVARSRQDVMPSSSEFGVLFVPRQTLADLGRAALQAFQESPSDLAEAQLYTLQLASDADMSNRLIYNLKPGADAEQIERRVEGLLGKQNVVTTTPREQLVGIELLQMDVDGFQEMAVAFPFFFLTVAGFIVAALMNRQVDQERPIIGTMLALGLSRQAVMKHYISYGLLIGFLGAALGSVAGILMGNEMTVAYAAELYIPFVTTHVDYAVVASGFLTGLLVPLAAAFLPARRAAGLEPAQAMRVFLPQRVPSLQLGSGWTRELPLWLRLPLRDIGRHPLRSLGTAAGVAAAVMLIVTTAGLFDSVERGLALAFDESQLYDLRADFYTLRSAKQLSYSVQRLRGVREVETILSLPVQVTNPQTGRSYDTVLQGLPSPSRLLKILDSSGVPLQPSHGRVLLARSVANELGVKEGDRVKVKQLPRGSDTTVTIGALSDALMGNSIVFTAEEAAEAFGMAGKATTVLLTVDPERAKDVRSDLEDLEGVAQVTDLRMMKRQIEDLMGLGYLFFGLMFVFGVVLASAILFNTATLSVLERQRELATMRALGVPMSGIARLITVENGLIALVGLGIGLPLSVASLWGLLLLFSSDLFSMPFWLQPRTVIASVFGVSVVLLVAQWPALRQVAQLNVAEASKMRE